MLPEHSCGDSSIRTPAFGDQFKLIRRGLEFQPPQFFHCYRQRQIACRPNISTPHRHQQINIGAPRTYSFYPCKNHSRLMIRQPREFVETQFALEDRAGQMKQIRGFLSCYSELTQVRFTEINKTFRREWIDGRLEPQQHRFRGLQRHLLFENDVDECGESRAAPPHRRRAVGRKYPGQGFVARTQMLRRLDQGFCS